MNVPQSQTGKATIENAQLFQLAMKLARFSNNSEEKQAFQEKAEKLWKFLTNATGILDPASFQVGIPYWEIWLQNFPQFKCSNEFSRKSQIILEVSNESHGTPSHTAWEIWLETVRYVFSRYKLQCSTNKIFAIGPLGCDDNFLLLLGKLSSWNKKHHFFKTNWRM